MTWRLTSRSSLRSTSLYGRSSGLVANHCPPPTIRRNREHPRRILFSTSTSYDPSSTMNPQARSLRPRRDASLPHPDQRLVAGGSKGVERKQSRQSLGGGGGLHLLRALCHLPRVVSTDLTLQSDADPATVEQQFRMLGSVLHPSLQHRDRADPSYLRSAGRNARLESCAEPGLALWSANAGTQVMVAALNIAYEEPERRSLFQYYLNALTFTIIGILHGHASRHPLHANPVHPYWLYARNLTCSPLKPLGSLTAERSSALRARSIAELCIG